MEDTGNDSNKTPSPEEIKAQVDAQVELQLAEIKKKLDAAYGARDEAVRTATQLQEQAKQKEIQALTDAGKTTEAMQLKLTAAEERLRLQQEQLTAYQRDAIVKEALGGLKFRNDRSREMAYRDVVGQLVQNQEGQWVHKTGIDIKSYVAAFAKDSENEFLFEPKANSGAGSQGGSGVPKLNKKVSEMTTNELLEAATSGKLGAFNL